MRSLHIVALLVIATFIGAIARLARLDSGGPAHSFVDLPGGEPATLYLPGVGNPFVNLLPPAAAERPAAVVLIHGFMSDRQMMSVLARRIAQNGYAVLAIDVQGHGENRHPLEGGAFVFDTLRADVQRAVDFLHTYPLVDGSRIIVMGHSMGAGAALDYATHEPSAQGAVMISGGWGLGPQRPRNALFIFAQHDPDEEIQQPAAALAAHLAGEPHADLGRIYGDFQRGNAVEALRVPDVDHLQIVYSSEAATTIVEWLDHVFGTPRTDPIAVADPRLGASGLALGIFLVLLAVLGRACGSLAPRWPERSGAARGWVGLAVLSVASLAAMPLVAMILPASFVSLVVGDVQISWFAVTGLMLIAGLTLSNGLDWRQMRDGVGRTLGAAAIGFAAIYVCQVALSVAFHRLSLTPERLIITMVVTPLLWPFWMSFEWLVRRGGPVMGTALGMTGRFIMLLIIVLGVRLEVLPSVLMLVLPSLALIVVMIEIFAAAAYSASRNLLLIAVVESVWFAWIMAATNPITFML
jgi:dienelactone hydrolase